MNFSTDDIVDAAPELEVSVDDFNTKQTQFKKSAKARRRWRLLKYVRMGVRRTSLTKPEAELLKVLNKPTGTTLPESSDTADSVRDAPDEPEAATAARSKLKQAISRHRASLTGTESAFLQALAEAREVSPEALENTYKVLEQDKLYNIKEEDDEDTIQPQKDNTEGDKPARRQSQEHLPREDFRMELWKNKQASTKSLLKDTSAKSIQSDVSDEDRDEKNKKPQEQTISGYLMNLWDSSGKIETEEKAKEEEETKEDTTPDQPNEIAFSILGTSAEDEASSPHVMTPPLMDSLRFDMPYVVQEDNFWLKYSLMRDGADMEILLSSVRSSSPTILAIETTDGEVFGAFTSSYWRHAGNNYYGSGESYLWRLRKSRQTQCDSVLSQAMLESDIEVFKWSGKNRNVQLSNPRKLVVGGGEPDEDCAKEENAEKVQWDFGLAMNKDLSSGTSGNCVTFNSPSLTKLGNGGTFAVMNVEVWTMTPVDDLDQAEKLELGRQFVFSNVAASSGKMAMAA